MSNLQVPLSFQAKIQMSLKRIVTFSKQTATCTRKFWKRLKKRCIWIDPRKELIVWRQQQQAQQEQMLLELRSWLSSFDESTCEFLDVFGGKSLDALKERMVWEKVSPMILGYLGYLGWSLEKAMSTWTQKSCFCLMELLPEMYCRWFLCRGPLYIYIHIYLFFYLFIYLLICLFIHYTHTVFATARICTNYFFIEL